MIPIDSIDDAGVDEVFTDIARRLLAQHVEQRQQQQQQQNSGNNNRDDAVDFDRMNSQSETKKGGCC